MMKTLPGTFASSAYVPAVFTKKSWHRMMTLLA